MEFSHSRDFVKAICNYQTATTASVVDFPVAKIINILTVIQWYPSDGIFPGSSLTNVYIKHFDSYSMVSKCWDIPRKLTDECLH